MVDDRIKALIDKLEEEKWIHSSGHSEKTIEYTFINRKDPHYSGKILLSPYFDVLYMEFAGLSNGHFARGEALDEADIENFVLAAVNSEVEQQKTLLGKKKIVIGDIMLSREVG